ncbi:MAG: glycosyltransferase family 9 protein [Planctomycetota bacterium]
MRVLVDYQGHWGLGDLLCSEPMVRGLRKLHGPDAEIRFRGHAGNAAYAPELSGREIPGFHPDRTVEVKLFTHMSPGDYARLEAMPSLVDHMLSYADVWPADRNPRLNLGPEERWFLGELGLERLPRPWIAIGPDDADVYRGWPLDRFRALAEHVQRRGGTLIELGLRRKLGVGVDLVGVMPIRGTAAVLSACDLFIGNNSSLLHYAQAADVPCLCFFSLALPERFIHQDRLVLPVQKQDLACIDCMTRDFEGRTKAGCETAPVALCMKELRLDRALEAFDRIRDEYLADCPRPGHEGQRARAFRARVYSELASRLLERRYHDRARLFLADAERRVPRSGDLIPLPSASGLLRDACETGEPATGEGRSPGCMIAVSSSRSAATAGSTTR